MRKTDPVEVLDGRRVILGVSGGIAAYKSATLVRLLKKAGADVQVLMTPGATRFISPLTLGTLSERQVLVEIFPANEDGSWTKHVHLGEWADLYVVAPATAQTMAKLAHGFCDSMLTAVALSARCPLLICPAMDDAMYHHAATRANVARLRERGCRIMEPARGALASGLVGVGRLPEPEEIVARVAAELASAEHSSFEGKHFLVTAGPTREHLDPVRFLSNPSTGTMGFALAGAAAGMGARVTLVTGPVTLATPPGVERVDVTSAEQMRAAVDQHAHADVVIMAAAVADYAPENKAASKHKKNDGDLTLVLRRTPDILASLGEKKRPGQVLVGFAMETDDAENNARGKLERKHLDLIVLNDLNEPGAGFGTKTNRVTLFSRDGGREALPLQSKHAVAAAILDRIAGLLRA